MASLLRAACSLCHRRLRFRPFSSVPLFIPLLALLLSACATPSNRYALVEESLRAGDTTRAAAIVEQTQQEYGAESQVLYRMDRGMTLALAGQYQASNDVLEQAEEEVDRLYTRRVSTEAKAFLTNDSKLPYEGDPYEQTMINVVKALNYAAMGKWAESLVEVRRLDHRLNVLADAGSDGYRDDPFGRYLSGVLYESSGDLNNAYIAYRQSHEGYAAAVSWLRTPAPPSLGADLLRLSDALHFTDDHEQYKKQLGETSWRPQSETSGLGQVIVITLNGRAPRKEDQFLDIPVSLDALQLVLLAKSGGGRGNTPERRAFESTVYGLNGRVVRVALPTLVPQKSQVAYSRINVSGPGGAYAVRTELAHNLTAAADKCLSAQIKGIAVKAAARAALKFALAEGVHQGARAAAGNDAGGQLVGILVGAVAKAVAVASEEADKRNWRTLPDEIHIGRMWLPPGEYQVKIDSVDRNGAGIGRESVHTVALEAGRTTLIVRRVLN